MMRFDAMRKLVSKPALWLTLFFIWLVLEMPRLAPVLSSIFPDDPRPLYTRASFLELTLAHVSLVVFSTSLAALIAVSAGIFVTRGIGREFLPLISSVAAIGQTFPPIAVLALTIPMLGFGAAPTLTALTIYAILPILAATILGLDSVPLHVREAARGMGFSRAEILRHIEMPLALPFFLAGLQNATIINIGTATIGSSIGALSLGSPILEGLSANNPAYVVEGAVLVALLAIVVNGWFQVFEDGVFSREADRGSR
jgi:osmoprotectant transport system permease protein